jgi:hypothetical protein
LGRTIEGALKQVEGKTKKEIAMKSEREVRKLLGMKQRYRDPVASGHAQRPAEKVQP